MSALTTLFTNIANAIRTKKGTSESITATDFPTEIGTIETGSDYINDTVSINGAYCGAALIKKLPKLTLPSNQTTVNSAFYRFANLQEVDVSGWSTSNVTNMGSTFYYCRKLTTLNLSDWNTSNVTNMSSMFYYCDKLQTITLSNNFDCSKVTSVASMFGSCSALETITGGSLKNLGQGYTNTTVGYSNYTLTLSSTKLDHDSLMRIINGLYDLATANKAAQKLVLGSTLQAKLTATEIAIATNKGWTVS